VSGTNLTNNITITPPAGYEVSSGNNTWYNSSTPLVLTQTSGMVPRTNISVRLNGTTAGSYNGNIVNASTGAASVNVPVSGTIQTDSLHAGVVLEQWPLSTDNNDSAAARAAGIVGTTSVLKNLVLSNGTVANTPAAYSNDHGQAYAATADGYWTSAMGGPGGTLSRNYYEQFTVIADTLHKLRIDSILLSTAFYNTSSNTKLAVVYSVSNFRSDSTEIKVVSKNGTVATAGTSGNFSNAFDVSNQSTATTDLFTMLVNGSAGVTMNSGDTFAFRIYHCTGSTSAGRYALLKNVIVKGASIANAVTAPPPVAVQPPPVNAPVVDSVTDYRVSPNPAHNYVSVYHKQLYTVAMINIYNMNGYLVGSYGSKPATNHTTINISALPGGMYFIEVRRLNDRALLRFIKQ
jgi:pectinesterase